MNRFTFYLLISILFYLLGAFYRQNSFTTQFAANIPPDVSGKRDKVSENLISGKIISELLPGIRVLAGIESDLLSAQNSASSFQTQFPKNSLLNPVNSRLIINWLEKKTSRRFFSNFAQSRSPEELKQIIQRLRYTVKLEDRLEIALLCASIVKSIDYVSIFEIARSNDCSNQRFADIIQFNSSIRISAELWTAVTAGLVENASVHHENLSSEILLANQYRAWTPDVLPSDFISRNLDLLLTLNVELGNRLNSDLICEICARDPVAAANNIFQHPQTEDNILAKKMERIIKASSVSQLFEIAKLAAQNPASASSSSSNIELACGALGKLVDGHALLTPDQRKLVISIATGLPEFSDKLNLVATFQRKLNQ